MKNDPCFFWTDIKGSAQQQWPPDKKRHDAALSATF